MLTIYGMKYEQQDIDKTVLQFPDTVFDVYYDDSWLDSEWSRGLISDIQRIDVTNTCQTTREILWNYGLRPEDLAGGTKNVLCARYFDEMKLKTRMDKMGPNCFKWLIDAADVKDIEATTTLSITFTDEDLRGHVIYYADIDKYVRTYWESLQAISQLAGKRLI